MTRSTKMALAGVVVAALVFRVLLIAVLPESSRFTSDTTFYVALAENLLEGHGFSSSTAPPFEPSIERPPGYPALIAAVWALTGKSFAALSAAQLVLDLLAVVLVFAAARRRFGDRVGLVAAALYALLPFPAGVSIQYMSEGLASFGVALAIYAQTRALYSNVPARWAFACGVAWGIATLARSYLAPMAVVSALVLVLELARKNHRLRSLTVTFASLGMGATCLVGSWIARNAHLAATTDTPFVLLEQFGSRGVFIKMYTPEFRAWYKSYDEPFYWQDWKSPPRANYLTGDEEREVAALWEQIVENDGLVTEAMSARFARITEQRYARAPLRLYILRPITVALKFWFSPRASSVRFSMAEGSGLAIASRWVVYVFFALNASFALLAIIGAVSRRRYGDSPFLWAIPVVLTVILTVIVHRESRLTVPLFPLVSIAAAVGTEVIRSFLSRSRARRGREDVRAGSAR